MTLDEKIVDAVARAAWREIRGAPVGGGDGQTYVVHTLTAELMRRIARAAITAYQAEAWQPIETFDGSEAYVLVWDGYDVSEARYHPNEDGWWLANTDSTDYHDGQVYPTHWMPKPLPPAPSDWSET